jgi:hypothetical protein
MDGCALMDVFIPVEGICYDVAYLTRRMLRRDHFLQTEISHANRELIAYHVVLSRPRHSFDYLDCPFAYPSYFITSVDVGRA